MKADDRMNKLSLNENYESITLEKVQSRNDRCQVSKTISIKAEFVQSIAVGWKKVDGKGGVFQA